MIKTNESRIMIFQEQQIRELEGVLLDKDGNLKIVSYHLLKKFKQEQISQFCLKYGIYNLPTLELVEILKAELKGKENKTIEIGAGNGVLANSLGIIATDSFHQNRPEIKRIYDMLKQPIVKYGANVLKYNANKALKKFNPANVLGCWVTHIYDPLEPWREGNQDGIYEQDIIKKAKYIFVGNEITHKNKKILEIPHRTIKSEFLLSRSMNKENNIIWIWEKQ